MRGRERSFCPRINVSSLDFFQTLASAEGNILENKVLLESLNKTKASSMTIAESLQDAHRIQTTLDQVRINLCQVIYVQNRLIFLSLEELFSTKLRSCRWTAFVLRLLIVLPSRFFAIHFFFVTASRLTA